MGCCQSKESKQVNQDPNPPKKKKNLKEVLDGSRMEEEKEWLSSRKNEKQKLEKEIKVSKKEKEEKDETDKFESTLNKEKEKNFEKKKQKIQLNKKPPQRSNSMINPKIMIKVDDNDEIDIKKSPKTEKKFDVSKSNENDEKEGTIISDTITINKNEVNQINEKSKKLEQENVSLKNENQELKRQLTELMGMDQSELDINKEILAEVLNNKNTFKLEMKKKKKEVYHKKNLVDDFDPKQKREELIEKVIENQSNDGDFEIKLETEEDEIEEEADEKNQNLDLKKKTEGAVVSEKGKLDKKKSKFEHDNDETIEKVGKKKIGNSSRLGEKLKGSKGKLKKILNGTKPGVNLNNVENFDFGKDEEGNDLYNERKINIKNTKLTSKSDKNEFLIEKFESEEKYQEYLKARETPILTAKEIEEYNKTGESK